jgi:hypothetical protein
MSAGTDIYTALGLRKIRDAAGSVSKVKIQYITLGDGLGAAYAPDADQTELRRERLRVEIERHYPVGDSAWYVKASFAPGVTAITVREMGFHDEDGDLIALWAGLDVGANRRTGAHEYLIGHTLDFSAIEAGLVMIDAPLDEYLDHMVLKLTTAAITFDRQLAQSKQIHGLTQAA